MTGCIACGNPVSLKESGEVIVLTEKESLEIEQCIPNEKWPSSHKYTYQSFSELDQIAEGLRQSLSSDSAQVIINGNTRLPFARFYALVKDRKLVELIIHGEFTVHLQPIIQLKDGGLYGYEALLRPELNGTPVSPKRLFEAAEATGLQSLLDQKARKAAVITKHRYILDELYLFINFLPSTIYNPDYCLKHTFSIIEEYQVKAEKLVFEVVETEEVIDMCHLKSILETYKKNGMNVALDDVGAGYSTLDTLTSLNPDIVKIDRHYVSGCYDNKEKQEFLQKVISTAKRLNIQVLAEGIEDQYELDYCKSIGVDFAQGYFIGKPQAKPVDFSKSGVGHSEFI